MFGPLMYTELDVSTSLLCRCCEINAFDFVDKNNNEEFLKF